jgi:threonine dehydratase
LGRPIITTCFIEYHCIAQRHQMQGPQFGYSNTGFLSILMSVDSSALFQSIVSADVSGAAILTPLSPMPMLSQKYQNTCFAKREDQQPVFSFKCRGAYNKIRQLSAQNRLSGIITASAGNHAQGVALSASQLRIDATIVMPQTTPSIKVNAVRALGGQVVLHGDSYDEAYTHAQDLANRHQLTFIHPYDDWDVIAGQGTIALEILNQLTTPIDYVFVAVGGGGLLAGILAVFKQLSPQTQIIAVEPDTSNCLNAALEANKRVMLDSVGIFADGVAVKQIGERPFHVIQGQLDAAITVTTDAICAAIKDIYEEYRVIVEPAGALSWAGAKQWIKTHNLRDKTIVTIACGANMNFDRLRHIAERTDSNDHREHLLAVTIPEKPGALRAFCHAIGKQTITEFNYRFQSDDNAFVFVGIESNPDDPQFMSDFAKKGYSFYDLSQNECAKIHVRHMIGGIPTQRRLHERVFRYHFPERPGALLEFLNGLNDDWTISLFHYRNHGAAFGRVLVGFDIPPATSLDTVYNTLNAIGFSYVDETDNPAVRTFLCQS